MKPATKAICVLILAAAMLLLFAPSALAADADEVYVNNVKLDANYPYWVNGDTAATKTKPAGGYNAYFDAASSTLALSNAVLHTTYFDGAYRSMVYANGDVSILLQGQNNFTYASAAYEYIIGVRGEGGLVLAGNGSADFQITLSYADAQACAVYAADTMLIYGCGITADLQAAYAAVGILSDRDIFFLDGYADIKTTARHSNGIYSLNSHLEVRGGSLSVTAVSTNESAFALTGDEVYLEGGEGVFRAYGPNVAHGLVFYDKNAALYRRTLYLYGGPVGAFVSHGYRERQRRVHFNGRAGVRGGSAERKRDVFVDVGGKGWTAGINGGAHVRLPLCAIRRVA